MELQYRLGRLSVGQVSTTYFTCLSEIALLSATLLLKACSCKPSAFLDAIKYRLAKVF
jgi:hypothetical protein